MENNSWKKGIKDLKNIGLNEEEKKILLRRVLARKETPASFSSRMFFGRDIMMIKNHAPVLATLLLVFMAGGVALASERSLPGDVLYPVKVSITEPARDLIKTDPAGKIEWQAEKAERRLEEAELLFVQERLDEEKIVKIENLFEKHTEDFKKATEKEIEIEYQFSDTRRVEIKVEQKGRTENPDMIRSQKDRVEQEKSIEAKKQMREIEKDREKLEREKEKAKKELEDQLEKMEKAKEKALKKTEKRSKND